jgi:hypothetical protein
MIRPTFLVIGAAKSGTTALHEFLQRHPEVCLPRTKETNFFAFEGRKVDFRGPGDQVTLAHSPLVRTVSTLQEYADAFDVKAVHRAIGEVCPLYLYSPEAPVNIRDHAPSARLIAMLRHPVDRAYSAFQMLVEHGREPLRDFREALEREPERMAANWEHAWHYASMSRYSEQLRRYYDRFDRSQILVLRYDEFEKRPDDTLRSIFEFIGVDSNVEIDTASRYNTSGIPRSEALFQFLRAPVVRRVARAIMPQQARILVGGALHRLNTKRTGVPEEWRKELMRLFHDDIVALQRRAGRDFSSWLET